MESQEYKIVQVSTKPLFFRRCKCGSFTTPVIMNDFEQGQEAFYCDSKCKKVITDLKTSYLLKLVVLDVCKNKLESIVAFDKAVADFIGCCPKEYLEFLNQDKLLSKKLEEQLVGMYCSARLEKRGRDSIRKARKLQLLYTDNIDLIDIIRKTPNEIHFDDSIL